MVCLTCGLVVVFVVHELCGSGVALGFIKPSGRDGPAMPISIACAPGIEIVCDCRVLPSASHDHCYRAVFFSGVAAGDIVWSFVVSSMSLRGCCGMSRIQCSLSLTSDLSIYSD
jgi:hypothetical protein